MEIKTNYNEIASMYDERYKANYLTAVEKSLIKIASENNVYKILEVGCGTGRWFKSLNTYNKNLFGLDYSIQMLKIAKNANNIDGLVNADASNLPFNNNSFNMIFCINAIHHFPDKKKFFMDAALCLDVNGVLCIYSVDPHIDKNWYVYDFFDGVYEKDLIRFPSLTETKNYCAMFNLRVEEQTLVERVYNSRTADEVFSDPFLKKNMNSQLANLTEEEYRNGIEKIKQKIVYQPDKKFITEVNFYLTKARKGV